MIPLEFICPMCRSSLEPRSQAYYCPECSKEYPYYLVNDVYIVDFKSLDTADCECNRDGKTVCRVELKNQILSQAGKAKSNYTGVRHKLVKEGFGSGSRILDLGCGEGPYSYLFTGENESYGLDTCPERMLLGEENAIDKGYKFDTIILDPPYAYRKAMEMYNGHYTSKFKQIADILSAILSDNGKVISFGYHSTFLGKKRNAELSKLCVFAHGGAQHCTIGIVEKLSKK